MNNKTDRAWELLDAIGEADEGFLADAEEHRRARRRNVWRYGPVAACLALALTVPLLVLLLRGGSDGTNPSQGGEGTGSMVLEASGTESSRPDGSRPGDESDPSSTPDGETPGDETSHPGTPNRPDDPPIPPAVFASAPNLMEGIVPARVPAKQADDKFLREQFRFSLALFQQAAKGEQAEGNSLLLSPLSAQLALSMAANGARGQTRAEMLALLAGDLSMEQLNGYLHTVSERLTATGDGYKVNVANAIWYNEGLQVYKEFLQTNADYYGAGAFQMPFDEQTRQAINAWASDKTDGLIPEFLAEIDPDSAMYLLNALLFDGEWLSIYYKENVLEGSFTSYNGETQKVSFLYSEEWTYYEDGKATGFAKPYKGGKYAFVALLPNEGVDVYDYVAGLTPEGLLRTLQNGNSEGAQVYLPKFSFAGETKLEETLSALGMGSAFDEETADFSGMIAGFDGDGHLQSVSQKTVISVGELGTKAAAVTAVDAAPDAADDPERTVRLDRPFVYMIVDAETSLPLFMGVQTEIDDAGVPEGQPPVGGDGDDPSGERPPYEEDYTGLTVSASSVPEGAQVLEICVTNGSERAFYFKNTDLLLQKKTAEGYVDFPFLGEPDAYSKTVAAGGTLRVTYRPDRDFGVTFRAGEVYRLSFTNVGEAEIGFDFTVEGTAEGLQLAIQVEERVTAARKFVFFEVQNVGSLDFLYSYADILVEHLTEDGWETFSYLDPEGVGRGDMLVKAGENHGMIVDLEDFGVQLVSGGTYRFALAHAPGVYGEFIVQ